ncbi:MAG: hypothetical protein GWN18_10250, partial [Thermoplasmata archaeon]|nr:hypothetical protein [Thermoplasmata archaeon]NIS12424.1 hypothetical protein [Thermoplasmata archaeon]NIS20346.1 hypothetical protein [Thermoplasmata archaeon]NIT77689.1 hypothetical protein [Thermoplasmata archaeon]NIU49435.1 hypothetical protein [Thermoplasmata archaeon]
MTMMIAWNMGEDVVVKIGGRINDVQYPEMVNALNWSMKGIKYGMSTIKGVVSFVSFVGDAIHFVQSAVAAYKAFDSFMKGINTVGRVLYLIDAL